MGVCRSGLVVPRTATYGVGERRAIGRMYQSGQLMLDELITTTYKLEDINQGYEDMHAGKNIRGVIVY